MSEINFGAGQTAAPAIEVPTTVTPVTPAAPAAPATPAAPAAPATTTPPPAPPTPSQLPAVAAPSGALSTPGPKGLILGDKIPDFAEMVIPRLNLVQNIGELKDSFEPGTLVYNKAVALYLPAKIVGQKMEREASPLVNIVALGFRPTRYCEKVPGGGKGIIVNTEADVRTNGGTLDFQEWKLKKDSGMKRFEQLADMLVAIERPANIQDNGTIFTYKVDGKDYALALWGLHGVNYTAVAKRVFFTQRGIGCLREGGYPSYVYTVGTKEEQYGTGNKAWIGICVAKEKTTPAFLDFVRSVIGDPGIPDPSATR